METPKRVGWANVSALKLWRQKYELSQEALAQRSGVSRATISSAEQGRRMKFAQADAIAAVFGVTRDKLAKEPEEEDVLVSA